MRLSRRNVLGLGASIAATATLAACGSNNPLESTSAAASSGATLSQWYHEYGEDGVQEAVERYAAAYPNATVEVQWNPGEYMNLVTAALLTNDFPDVFESENGATLDMIQAGQVADLTELVGSAVSSFNPSVIKRMTFQDKLWAIPQTIDMQMLYYRPSLLEAAGVSAPTTFEELVAAAEALTTSDMGGFFAGNNGGWDLLANEFIWSSGNDQLNADRTAAGFLNADFYAAISAYAKFYKSKGLLKAASDDWYSAAPLVNNETAMQFGGLWSLPELQEALGDDIAVVPFPAIGSNGRPSVPFGAYGSCVAAKGAQVDAAKDFVKWLWVDQEADQVDFSNSYGCHIPAKPALVAKADKIATGPGAEAAAFVTDYGFTSDIMWTGAIGTAYSDAVSNCITKGNDPKDEFASVGETITAELKRISG